MSVTLVKKHRQRSHHRRTISGFSDNDVVRQNGASWTTKAKAVGSAGLRSFYVRTENNTVLGHNRRHLLTAKERHNIRSSGDKDIADNQTPFQASPAVAQQPSPQPLRRSRRQTRPPERLGYDQQFRQISQRY
ncbi:hypothetical protein HPB52_003329 [Rhipicephalus sanguineus]|uniref:Uncharacterized protein n=1 Tax=Rhipicephalus sanguineus TaxID=34632 RepID=A0A9D4PDC4_RHISA|nr:hypothetical protein HPB52_003329 [Rhipicephalus sanguineus]